MCSRGGTWLSDGRRDVTVTSRTPVTAAATQSPQTRQVVDSNHNTDCSPGSKWTAAAGGYVDLGTSTPSASPAASELVERGVTYLRDRIFHRDSGFEKVSPQNHLSAVESLRRTKPLSVARSSFTDDSRLSSDGGNAPGHSPQKPGFSGYPHIAMACCTTPRAVNGKRRLSTSRRDDSSSGCERQRKYCGNMQQTLSPSKHSSEDQPQSSKDMTSASSDNAISQYLSLKVEQMDLQSDVPPALKPMSPNWTMVGKTETANGDVNLGKGIPVADCGRSFPKYRHDGHRGAGRRYRKPSGGGRAGTSSRERAYNLARQGDDKRLEKFFSQMGMDAQTFSATLSGSPAVSTLENVSSVDTSTLESRTSYADSERVGEAVVDSFDVNERDVVFSSSVVERNARIIKWLCSIRKASTSDDIEFDDGFV